MSHSKPTTVQLVLAFAAVYVIWGSTYLAIRFAVETVPPFLMAGARNAVAGGVLYVWFRARGAARPTRAEWKASIVTGGLMLLCGNGLVSWAEQFVPSGLAALIVATVPIWFVSLAWIGPDGEAPNLPEIGGILIGLAGVGLLMSGSLEDLGLGDATNSQVAWGVVALIIATITWAAGSIYSRRAPLAQPTVYATALTMLVGGVLLFVVGAGLGEFGRLELEAVSTRSFLSLLYLIVFGSIIAFSSYAWLIQVVRPALAGTYAYVNPIVAVFLGWWLADEMITREMAIGAVLIVGAVVLVERGRARARRRSKKIAEAA